MKKIAFLLIGSTLFSQALAEESLIEETLITGGKDAVKTLTGSAYILDQEALETFDYVDLQQVLTQIPGVYLRSEDGYGLRPNIGIRGVTSDRSQKITIMEDGILITPAPYSAPAAYYIPNVNRMQAVEVSKGPAAIKFGPNTVGGALNLVTRTVPKEKTAEFDISYGTDNFQKYRALYGDMYENFGYSIEGLHYSSDGFKELDNGGDTGFVRNDINANFLFKTDDDADTPQQLTIKLGYATEDSDETYLGLTDDDFYAKPERRYVSSALDKFESEHSQIHLLHLMQLSDNLVLSNKAYVNRFERSWKKFDGFINPDNCVTNKSCPPSASEVLANPDVFSREIGIFRGEINSKNNNETIDITDNDREYGSQGIASNLRWLFGENIGHTLDSGIRFHQDYVDRDHQQYGYLMTGATAGQLGHLENDGNSYGKKSLNRDETTAIALFLNDEISINDWKINAGLRYENIEGKHHDKKTGNKTSRTTDIVIPGLGVYYQWTESFGVLAGVNKGFSPNSPSASQEISPEESINYEYGFRYQEQEFSAEVIGFFSDYSNLVGRCRNSDEGCEVGEEFNGGDVEVSGVEVSSHYSAIFDAFKVPFSLTYTYTESAFQSTFGSGFSQWETVYKGDALPYLPEHQLRFQTGIQTHQWDLLAAIKYMGEMREEPGQGDISNGVYTKALTTIDVAANYFINDNWIAQLNLENISNEQEIVSRRPFGARPNKPRSAVATLRYRF